jgi:hypothetical protein
MVATALEPLTLNELSAPQNISSEAFESCIVGALQVPLTQRDNDLYSFSALLLS